MYPQARRQRGLTLMELLITIAIIGVLAAAAVPQYQNYVAKAQIKRAIAELSGLRTEVERILTQAPNAQGVDAAGLGFLGSDLSTSMPTVTAAVTGEVSITMAMDGSAASVINGLDAEISRDVNGIWSCVIRLNGAPNNAAYIPSDCTILPN